MYNQVTHRPEYSDQLLIVIRAKGGIGINQFIKAFN